MGDDVRHRRRDPRGLGALFLVVLARGQTASRSEPGTYRFSVAVRPPRSLPAALNGFGLWLGLMVALTIVNYGFPIAHALATQGSAVPAVKIGARQ
jgi:cytochrome c oxidase subunit I